MRGSTADKTFLIKLKSSPPRLHMVTAACVEVHSDHLAFLDAEGRLLYLFLLDAIESWNAL
jgi:hypothetical protein